MCAHAGIVADQTIIRRVSNEFTAGLDSFLPVDSLSLAYGVMFVVQGDKPPKAKRESLVQSVQSPVGGALVYLAVFQTTTENLR